MNNKALKILLVEDNLADAKLIRQILNEYNWQKCHLKHVTKLTESADILSQDFDAILLNLSPVNEGITSLNVVRQKAPRSPIVILTATNEPKMAVQCLRQGAQDYLIKKELEGKILTRSIQHAIERQRYQFHLAQQTLMKQMLDKIRNSIDLEAILSSTATEIQQFLQCDRVLIYRPESIQSEATTVISQSVDGELDYPLSNFSNEGWFNSLMQSILTEFTSVRAIEDTKAIRSPELPIVPQMIRSYLIVPIWLSGSVECTYDDLMPTTELNVDLDCREELWGMLVAYNVSQTRKWRDWEIFFLQRLTTQVTIAISQSQLCCQLQTANQKLQQLAILDGLTNIANRRYFDLVLDKEWQRLAREQQPLSLILCDIDYFKAYNDAYGHQQGDLCLQKIARLLRNATRRPADLAARYGGEEFALILPNTNSQGALFIAQRIMDRLAERQIPHQKSAVSDYVTCSIGVTTKIPRPKQPVITIIKMADKLLYKAKAAGRNRLVTDSNYIS